MTIIRVYKKFKRIFSKRQMRRIFELVLLMVIGGCLETISVTMIVPFMKLVSNQEEAAQKWYIVYLYKLFDLNDYSSILAFLAILIAVSYLLKNVYVVLENYIQYRFVYGNMVDTQRRLLETIMKKPYEYFMWINTGELVQIVQDNTVNTFLLLANMLSLMTEIVVSCMIIGAVIIISPLLSVVILIVLFIVLAIINTVITPKAKKAGENYIRTGAEMNKWLLESVKGIKEIKLNDKSSFFVKHYWQFGQKYASSIRTNQTLSIIPKGIIETLAMGSLFLTLAIMIGSGEQMNSLLPTLTAIAFAAIKLIPSINKISVYNTALLYYEPMLDRLIVNIADLNSVADQRHKEDNTDVLVNSINLTNEVSFKDVFYNYPNTESDIFDNLNLKIQSGEVVGIVGASGAGKSTLIDLLAGLLSPRQGVITVDGANIHHNLKKWQSQIGYVSQSTYLIDSSIRDNVAFGIESDQIDDNMVRKALEKASLLEYVENLPDKLETKIGEQGVRISGGQRQRIGIARALYRNPKLLIFDEATSALDTETEKTIVESIANLKGQITMVIVAHRLSTLKSCDHIYRINNRNISLEKIE